MDQRENINKIQQVEYNVPDSGRITVDLFRPGEGRGIAGLFKTVYGEDYPVKLFYDPAGLIAAFESGQNYSVVARKGDGGIIGHVALFRSSPYPLLYEGGAGLVLPEYRNAGINKMLLNHLYEKVAPNLGIDEAWGEAVCNHVFMQRTIQQYGHVETGLEVDLMPAEAYAKEKSSSGRVASLVCFRTYRSRPHTVYLPEVYEGALRFLYSRIDDFRTLMASEAQIPSLRFSQASTQFFDFAQVARTSVINVGSDFEAYFDSLEKEILSKGMKVVQVWLKLACPWVGHAVDILRSRGYFFGALLARWFDDDGLLMQKIAGRPNWEGIQLFSDRARKILEIVRSDWERTLESHPFEESGR